jgi:pimeloyl-ACP methyl ester carboxylesterase
MSVIEQSKFAPLYQLSSDNRTESKIYVPADRKLSALSYELSGEGDTIVLLHGYGFDSTIWSKVKSLLIPHFQVITVDIPGFGESPFDKNASLDTLAKSIDALLIHLEIPKIVLVGHSMGGYIAAAYHSRYVNKLSGICLFHSHIYEDTEEKKVTRSKSIEFIQARGLRPYLKEMLPAMFHDTAIHQQSILQFTNKMKGSDAVVLTHYLDAMIGRNDYEEVFYKTEVPVLFILGKEDPAISADHAYNQLLLPITSKICILDNCAHMGMLEKPYQSYQQLRSFMHYCFSFELSR